jgi:hypothetical protein
MTKLLSVSRCPKCAERGNDKKGDNLAEYSDGWHCFSCGYRKPKMSLSHHLKRLEAFSDAKVCNGITLENKLLPDHLKWLLGYDLTLNEIKDFKYASKRVINGYETQCDLLVLLHNDAYWLARNFATTGNRYVSSGNKPCVKYGENTSMLVFVEDVISAIKVSRVATAIPMLGANIPLDWYKQARGYQNVILWGDNDKAVQNVKQSRKLSEYLGIPVRNVITEKDPKTYNVEYINNIINN